MFVRDPLTVRPGGEFSSLAKKTIPSLDEAAIQTELSEFQTWSHIRDVCRVPVCVVGGMLRGLQHSKETGILCSKVVWIDLHLLVLIFLYEHNIDL